MYKRLVCTTKEGLTIYEVKGREVRDYVNVEFALGCHDLRCKWVPNKEIWIEQLNDTEDMCLNAKHELIERWLMLSAGMTYNKAHTIASEVEKRERKTNRCNTDDFCKTGEFFSSEMKEHILEMLPMILEPEI